MITQNLIKFDTPLERKQKQSIADLNKTYSNSQRVLFRARSIFPFDFFPDEIVIDENRIDLIYGIFFLSKQVVSLSIQSINGAISTSNILFGSVEIEINGYHNNPEKINFLWNEDAIKARRIINGLVTCYKEGVDISVLNLESTKDTIEKIGQAARTE